MKLPVDSKSFAMIIVVLIVMVSLSSVIIYHEANDKTSEKTNGFQMVARANTEGSGIYIDAAVLAERGGPSAFYTDEGDGTYTIDSSNKAAWGGLILGTPGAATIQHVQLQQLATKMGLTWTLYQEGQTTDNDHIYYVGSLNNASKVINYTGKLDGGSLWEPQFSNIISNPKYVELALTNNVFPEHTCCIVAGMEDYMSSHVDATERFLAAYVLGMRYVNEALAEGGEKLAKLVEISKARTGITDDALILEALNNITYVDADYDGSLDELKTDVGDLYESLYDAGLLQHSIKDMGFNYTKQFVNAFVDDAYLINAVKRLNSDDTTLKTGKSANITVACISGDIHQIAIHVANELKYFQDFGITLNVSFADSGPGVAVALQNNTAQFGLLGAPPATSTTVNSLLLSA